MSLIADDKREAKKKPQLIKCEVFLYGCIL